MESGAVTVVHREFECKPNRQKGRDESFRLINIEEFVEYEEDGVHVRGGDGHILDKLGNSLNTRKRGGRHLVKPTPERGRFRELGCTR